MWSRRTHQAGSTQAKDRSDPITSRGERVSQRTTDPDVTASGRTQSDIATTGRTAVPTRDVAESSEVVTLWLRRADQMLLGTLLIALLVLLVAFRWKLSGGGLTEIEITSQQPREFFYSIDINNASWVEWAQLDGIGEKLARRIVKDREERGPFDSIDEIRRVHGFGPKLVEKLRPFLKCGSDRLSQTEPASPHSE